MIIYNKCFLVLILIALLTNTLVVYGNYLEKQGIEEYNKFCISKGNEKFLSLDSGYVKCYREDKLALYEDYQDNWKYFVGQLFGLLCFLNFFYVLFFLLILFTIPLEK